MPDWQRNFRASTLFDLEEHSACCGNYEMFLYPPGGRLPYTIANLAFMSQEEVRSLNISTETFQSLIDHWGLEAVLDNLGEQGFKHVGITVQIDGTLTRLDEK